MKYGRLTGVMQNAFLGLKNVSSYSTKTTTEAKTRRKPLNLSVDSLYRRITPLGGRTVSIVPVLDQWIQEERTVSKEQLVVFIKELRYYKRYNHALQISMWMSDKRYFPLTNGDIAIRLDLIAKVHGIEQAENYFNNVPKQLRVREVYSALINCYAQVKSVEKAEVVMQQMCDLGLGMTSLAYNVLLNLYYQIGNREKFNTLIQEMKEKGIRFDNYTYGILVSAYAAVSDIEGIDKILKRMESDPKVVLDWTLYAVAANGYTKVGLLDKAVAVLKKSEELVTSKKRSRAYDFLLTQYTATGNKDEVLRLWEVYKEEKVFNRGYISILTSLLKFNDIESAQQIFDEWQSQDLVYDIRIPNFLIGAYCRKGLLEKAEILVNEVISKGGKPDAFTWYYLASGYLQNDEASKAVEAMKQALLVCRPGWKLGLESLAACLKYLKEEGNMEEAEEFIGLLRDKDIVS